MESNKIVCINCGEVINADERICPNCGKVTIRSRSLARNIKSFGDSLDDSAISWLSRRYDVSSEKVEKLLKLYNDKLDDFFDKVYSSKIVKVKVDSLFGYLNYEIDLMNDLSIVIAPNGFGKTTIFKLISFILKPTIEKYQNDVKSLPFQSVSLTTNDEILITFARKNNSDSSYCFTIGNETKELVFSNDSNDDDYYGPSIRSRKSETNPIGDMKEMLEKANVHCDLLFIKTDRAFSPISFVSQANRFRRDSENDEDLLKYDPLFSCSTDLKQIIVKTKENYQELIEKTKNNFPQEFLKLKEPTMNYQDFVDAYQKYMGKTKALTEYGLLEKDDSVLLDDILSEKEYLENKQGKSNFLSLYVERYSAALDVFRNLYRNMKLFRSIINSRNEGTKKHLEYSRLGFEYYNNEQKIELQCLSSGEKNDFIMFFDLIFRTNSGTIILIDEPEISLHINWQEKYIHNIVAALDGRNCQVIISTHSPDIISTHDDKVTQPKIKQ